ncbi:MAG: sigma-54 interaction domain-containing protein [Anaerovoracaceae bacterium]
MNKDLKNIIENPSVLTMLNSLSEYIYITDDKGYVRFINHAAEKFEQQSNSEICGKHINDIYTQKESPTLKALSTCKPVDEHENIYMFNGKQYNQLAKSIPLFSGGELIGACTIQRDMTLVTQILSDNASLQKNQQKSSKQNIKTFDSLIGKHPDFVKSVELAKAASKNDSSVLLAGFTGSGKEVFANAVHNASMRKDKAFLAINCATVPDGLLESILFGTTKGTFTGSLDKTGLFEQAEGGTLFLDEINSMSLNSQAKLLRVLEEKEIRKLGGDSNIKVNVRIISSINTTPRLALQRGQLREDLFYRLSVNTVIIPPLKDRLLDIELLTEHFIRKFNGKFSKNIKGLSPEVYNFFMSYSWPGNVRQLKHVIESAINISDESSDKINLEDMPHYLFENQSTSYVETFSHMKEPSYGEDISENIMANLSSNSLTDIIEDTDNVNVISKRSAGLKANHGRSILIENKNDKTYENESIENHELSAENLYAAIRKNEKKQIMQALIDCNGNVSKAARSLNMNRQSLVYRMKKYNIKR